MVFSFIYCKLNSAKQQLYKNRNEGHVFSCYIHPRRSYRSCPDLVGDDSSNQHTKYVKKTFAVYWMYSRRDFGGGKHFARMSAIVPKSVFTFGLKRLMLPSKCIYQGIESCRVSWKEGICTVYSFTSRNPYFLMSSLP